MKKIELTISSIIRQPNDIVTYKLTHIEPIWFTSGQFIILEFIVNGKYIRRSYSLNNSPYVNEPLSISVKRVDNGEISRLLQDKYTIGDKLTSYEASGQFVFEPQPTAKRNIFLLGAGSGIAPLFSILKSALVTEKNSNIILVYSNRAPETTLFYDELLAIKKRYPIQFISIFLFSTAKNLSMARLNRELLERLVIEHSHFPNKQSLFYTCGPADYMLMCKIVLTGMGFADQLKKETFVLPEDESDEDDETGLETKAIDKASYTVKLTANKISHNLAIPYPKTILDVALERGIEIPYSCKAGMCGSCIAKCTQGKVKMLYNEVLTDNEVRQGKILLCAARPLEDDVELNINW